MISNNNGLFKVYNHDGIRKNHSLKSPTQLSKAVVSH